MKLRVGLVSAAHVHTPSYAHHFAAHQRTEVAGVWDDDAERGSKFASERGLKFFSSLEELLQHSDAVAISSENVKHLDHITVCAKAGKHILCEKPVVVRSQDFDSVRKVISESGVKFMTAFPCRFSPGYASVKAKIARGDIGKVLAINATNRGMCPHLWFTNPELSGGGAMIDHVVHVADLLRDLLGSEPDEVHAQIGSNMYGGEKWDDTAMVSMVYPGGLIATLDSSWSRHSSFKTWGDVTMRIVGETGIIDVNLFEQGLDYFHSGGNTHGLASFGSDLDGAMVDAFVRSCLDDDSIPVTLEDGLAAVRVSLRGYASVGSVK